MEYQIFSDVSLDLDQETAKKCEIQYIPMEYTVGEYTYNCTRPQKDEEMHLFYDKLRAGLDTKTTQITPLHYLECFEPLVKKGMALIYLCLSSGLSNTYSSASLAVMQLKEIYDDVQIEVIDTLGATGGMGLLAERAYQNKELGMTLEENAADLRERAHDIHYWFKVEDLMYLQRGGRISAGAAIIGTALNIKPILTIRDNGRLETVDKKRGNKQAMRCLLNHFEDSYVPDYGNTVYICHTDCKEDAQTLKEKLQVSHPDLDIRVIMMGPIIGAHTGPGMFSLVYYGKNRT